MRGLALVCALLALILPKPSRAQPTESSTEMILRPGASGTLGLLLYSGPFFRADQKLSLVANNNNAVAQPSERPVVPIGLGAAISADRKWRLAHASNGRFNVRDLVSTQANSYALFAGVLRASSDCEVVMIMQADDGLWVQLDDQVVFDKDLVRAPSHADDAVRIRLSKGDHPLVIRLRQRSGPWQFSARLLDASNLAPSHTVNVVLPGVEQRNVDLSKLLRVDVSMHTFSDRYEPTVHIQAPGGLPALMRPQITVEASVDSPHASGLNSSLFHANLGQIPQSSTRVHALRARVPTVYASNLQKDSTETPFKLVVRTDNATWTFVQRGNPQVRSAIGAIDEALERIERTNESPENTASNGNVVRASLQLYRQRLDEILSTRDADMPATIAEARASEAFARHVLQGHNPLQRVQGPVRLAYRSKIDGENRPFAVYVPSTNNDTKANNDENTTSTPRPLVVALHGLNGLPMQMLRVFFGQDHPTQRAPWEDRHVSGLAPLDAYVVAPSGFGNISYREYGEVDVMHLVAWMKEHFPIDPNRVYVTGLSMGGTGAAAVGLRYADQFASILSLCGYHSYALRRDMSNRRLRWWEKSLASFWSNVSWAENGLNVPLFVVHGTKDLPVANSGVLIDRYQQLGYNVVSEHPETGHNVWQQTYEGFKGYRLMAAHKRNPEPKHVVLKTASLRYASNAWVRITALQQHLSWGQVDARVKDASTIDVKASAVQGFSLTPPTSHIRTSAPLTVIVNSTSLTFNPGENISTHRQNDTWHKGPPPAPDKSSAFVKKPGLSGPIRDAFLEPLVFVVGTQDPSLTQANLHVAQALAEPQHGIEARWPVIADVDVTPKLAKEHALFLIGSAASNSYVAQIDNRLPIHVREGAIVMDGKRFESAGVGAVFVHPNPLFPDRYVVVLQAPDVIGTLRALSLPRMLPDYIIYDHNVAAARGQVVLGNATILAGGMFDEHWQLAKHLTEDATPR